MVQVDEFPDDFQKEFRARVMPEYGDAAFVKPPELKDCRVALISTAGVHRRGDRPFTHESGDYRIIEKDLAAEDFVMSHVSTNFDRSGFQQDINVALPLDRLNELAEEGVIGSVADYHYAFMGATPPGKMKPNIEEISRTLKKDNVTAIVLCPVWPSCTGAVGGLGHFLERAGFATTQISLVREHTLQINPPRALLTPFELGRPFGAPNEPEFQKRVLVETLNLLTRDKGPVLEEWTEAAPGPKADLEGWTCPVDFGPGMDAVDVNVDPFTAVMQEIDKLRPWHDTAEKKLGRTTFGIANLELDVIVRYLVDFIEDTDAPLPLSGMPRYQAVKLCIDDLKAFYFESALAQPGVATDFELANWYYAETIVSDMLVRLNSVCAATDDAVLKRMSIRGIIPAHQAHRKNSC